MEPQTAAAPATPHNTSFNVIRILALPWVPPTFAAVIFVLVTYVASDTVPAAKLATITNIHSLPGSSISAYVAEPDYPQGYVPEKQSDGEFAQIEVGKLVLYYEVVMLFTALVIGIGACTPRAGARKQAEPALGT